MSYENFYWTITLSFELTILNDKNNSLLGRREVHISFKEAAGKISRIELKEIVAKYLKMKNEYIVPISLQPKKGKRDLKAVFHIYKDEADAKNIIPRYRLLRILTKEERKKILDEEKAIKLKAKQAAAAEKKGGKR